MGIRQAPVMMGGRLTYTCHDCGSPALYEYDDITLCYFHYLECGRLDYDRLRKKWKEENYTG